MTQEQALDAAFRREVAQLIASHREANAVSQTALGDAVGVSRSAVVRWEKAERDISFRHWTMVATMLGIPKKGWPVRFVTPGA